MTQDENDLIIKFEQLAVQRVQEPSPKKGNRLFDKMRKVAKELRATEEGRLALEGLLIHPLPGVRLEAAAFSLAWDSPRGIATLEELVALPPGLGLGLVSFTAEMTLKEYRAGRLTFDWW